MEKFTFIFCFIVSQNFLFAQTYQTLPDSNASWVVVRFLSTPFTYQWFNYHTSINKDDTLINSKQYTKLFEQNFYGGYGYVGAYHSDTSGKTWFVPKDSTQEFLLMDLSKNKGDTIYNVLAPYTTGLMNVVVDSVNNISVGPYTLKQLGIYQVGGSPFSSWYWIEKIGSTIGFFNGSDNPFEPDYTYCMSFNDTVYYQTQCCPTYSYGVCNIPIGVNENTFSKEISIAPNPFSNSFKVLFDKEFLDEISLLTIYNSQGVVCKMLSIKSVKDIQIDCHGLSSGLYLIDVFNKENNFIISKRIIKE